MNRRHSTWVVLLISVSVLTTSVFYRVGTASASGALDSEEAAHYTCSMHPTVKQSVQGLCPICNMDLTPVTQNEIDTGIIHVDSVRRQRIGVRTGAVVHGPMKLHLRAVGRIAYDETRLSEVNLRVSGWIEKLMVNRTGQFVKRGQTLFVIYSPELYSAQEEFLQTIRSQKNSKSTSGPDRVDGLVHASRKRLHLWGLSESQLDDLVVRGAATETVSIRAPTSGYVIEKNLVEGSYAKAGMTLYRIASLDHVWVEANVYESDLPNVSVGQRVRVTLLYLPGREYEARVSYVYPYLDNKTRTGRLRVELPNPELELRPDMYANMVFDIDLGNRLQVPESAVLYTGTRRLVFVDLGEGRLQPKEIQIGLKNDDYYEVLGGLVEGDIVVTSGNFLIAAESRIRSATKYWSGDDD